MDKVLETMRLFPKQCVQTAEDFGRITKPVYESLKNITVCAMGASAFGYQIANSLFKNSLKIPLLLHSDYDLPDYIDKNSLVICVSYSGQTEETISSYKEAKSRDANIFVITQQNSELGNLALTDHKDVYFIEPKFNPANQPRMATGYTTTSMLLLLNLLELIGATDIIRITNYLTHNLDELEEQAKETANKLQDKMILIIAGQHLSGNAHILRNQFNESAKNMAFYNILPELNHHLLEGLTFPKQVKKYMTSVFIDSGFYSNKIKLRSDLTKEILLKNNINNISLKFQTENKIQEVFLLLAFNGFLSYYFSKVNKVNPVEIPWVNYFKEKLSAQNVK